MTFGRITRIAFLVSIAILLFPFIASSGGHRAAAAQPQFEQANPHCRPVGGTVMTNFGAIDQNTTLGTATGDLRGAVSGTILGAPQPGAGNTVIFHVQHHWVTESGDTLSFDQATATTKEVVPNSGLFAILDYPVHIKGGTGRFAGATGDFNNIGAADLGTGRTVFRYSGQVCFASPDKE